MDAKVSYKGSANIFLSFAHGTMEFSNAEVLIEPLVPGVSSVVSTFDPLPLGATEIRIGFDGTMQLVGLVTYHSGTTLHLVDIQFRAILKNASPNKIVS